MAYIFSSHSHTGLHTHTYYQEKQLKFRCVTYTTAVRRRGSGPNYIYLMLGELGTSVLDPGLCLLFSTHILFKHAYYKNNNKFGYI